MQSAKIKTEPETLITYVGVSKKLRIRRRVQGVASVSYEEVFKKATCHNDPYQFQIDLALAPSMPTFVNIPTGCGKTEAIILSWIWRRHFAGEAVRSATPLRLVYCLPMRTLVRQTRGVALRCISNLALDGLDGVSVHTVMGGDLDYEWTLHPQSEAIIIGTQDLLLSAALNRGYGLSRFRWPQAFGLLHSNSLWVFDEIQLFGVGLSTAAQLEGFRRIWGTALSTQSIWMSATLNQRWLATIDNPPGTDVTIQLGPSDLGPGTLLHRRLHAKKPLNQLQVPSGPKDKPNLNELADRILSAHQCGTFTLVIVNTVDRATKLYKALCTKQIPCTLLHSRFRPHERAAILDRVTCAEKDDGRIVVSTQVVEAGVDISSTTLITELAPWSSLVQRFGRCNRRGETAEARVLWLDITDDAAAPYHKDDMEFARNLLRNLEGQSVAAADLPTVNLSLERTDVVRQRDLLDLFDTGPDIFGNDVDVSRFVRNTDQRDVRVFWRLLAENGAPTSDISGPQHDELCPVPLSELRVYLNQGRSAWTWDHLEGRWARLRAVDVRPSMTVLLNASEGGYTDDIGWDTKSTRPVAPVNIRMAPPPEAMEDGRTSEGEWQTIAQHADDLVRELERYLTGLEPSVVVALRASARWHDAGKSHAVFQNTLTKHEEPPRDAIWAKSPHPAKHERRYFRHELASALAMLAHDPSSPFLAAYLVAAHHGRVRLTIRSAPDESSPQPTRPFALGIWHGDRLPETDLGGGVVMPAVQLDLTPMELGHGPQAPSWTERALRLRDALGPFRLAYLESLLRAADVAASRGASKGAPKQDGTN